MTCHLCGEEITGYFARFKKFGSEEYFMFHLDNDTNGRSQSCWKLWLSANSTLSLAKIPSAPEKRPFAVRCLDPAGEIYPGRKRVL
jgi:hypothetical protein